MKTAFISALTAVILLSACNQRASEPAASASVSAAPRAELTPENLTDPRWKNGVLIKKDALNGFFVKGDPAAVAPAVGAKLVFAKSGERKVTNVVVNPPYVNIYVDQPLDPDGDGFPNKVKQ